MNEKEPLISIIIPVYNVEKYLEQCVKSVINQTYKKLEIILVDDGSPDKCPELCDEYAKQDSRIKVIHKKNGGLSSARNTGLDIASGEYIGFVDSDDYVSTYMFECLLDHILERETVGMVKCMHVKDDNGRIVSYGHWNFHEKLEIESGEYAMSFILDRLCNSVWDTLFRSSLLKNIRFSEGKINEDSLFHYYLSKEVEKFKYNLVVIPDALYFYRKNNDSISNAKLSPLPFYEISNLLEMKADCKYNRSLLVQPINIKLATRIYMANILMIENEIFKNKYWKDYHRLVFDYSIKDLPVAWGARHVIGWQLIKYFPFLMTCDKIRSFCNKNGVTPPCVNYETVFKKK